MDEYNVIEVDEMIIGTAADDELMGTDGSDYIEGGAGIDWLEGGYGDDILIGSDNFGVGIGEIDVLHGGAGSDLFMVGNNIDGVGHVPFYAGFGDSDYAVINDFTAGEDVILLAGIAEEYSLGSISNDLVSGTGIYWGNELVAIAAETTISDLNTGLDFTMG
ncbi:MAG: hypothetical protein Kow00121_59860 [Elainellaceae cyanobacterium]